MADWVSATLDLSPQAASRLLTAARTELPEIRQKMLAGEWGIDRAAAVSKLAAAGLPADQLLDTADTFSLGRLYGLLEKTRRLDADTEAFDHDWRYLVCQPSLDESVFKLWGQLPGPDGQVVLNAVSPPKGGVAADEGGGRGGVFLPPREAVPFRVGWSETTPRRSIERPPPLRCARVLPPPGGETDPTPWARSSVAAKSE